MVDRGLDRQEDPQYSRRPVPLSGDDAAVVGAEGGVLDRTLVAAKDGDCLAAGGVPPRTLAYSQFIGDDLAPPVSHAFGSGFHSLASHSASAIRSGFIIP